METAKRKDNILSVIVDKLSFFAGSMSVITMIVCAVIVVIDILGRWTGHPTKWGPDITSYLVGIFVFLAFAEGLRKDTHVRADIVLSMMNARMKRLMSAVGLVIVMITTGVLAYLTIAWAADSVRKGDTTYGIIALKYWPAKCLMAFSVTMICLVALRKLVPEFIAVFRNEDDMPFGKRISLSNPWIVVPVFVILIALACYLLKASPIIGLSLLLITLLLSGTPIGFSVMTTAMACLYLTYNGWMSLLSTPSVPFFYVNNYSMLALPMFVLAGNIMARGGIGNDLFNLASAFVGHLRGGLGIAVAIAAAIFGCISGNSSATCMTIATVAYPLLLEHGYDAKTSAGLLATCGGIGILIPPSNAAINYGLVSGQPIGTMFIAGVVPGILMAAVLAGTTLILVRKNDNIKVMPKVPWKQRVKVLKSSFFAILMPIIVLGGIYTGFFTVTEAAAVAAIYSIVYSLLARTIKLKEMWSIFVTSSQSMALVLLILCSSAMLKSCITMLQLPNKLMVALGNTPGWIVVGAMLVLVIFLGMFLDGGSIVALTVPVIAPVLTAYNYSLVWFGTLLIVTTCTATITPPVGLDLFIMQRIGKLDLGTVVRGSVPYFMAMIVLILAVALIPQLVLWLPSHMLG